MSWLKHIKLFFKLAIRCGFKNLETSFILLLNLAIISYIIYNLVVYNSLFRHIGNDSASYVGLIKAMAEDPRPLESIPKEILYPDFYKYKNLHIGPNVLLMVLLLKCINTTAEKVFSIFAIFNPIMIVLSYYLFCRIFFPKKESLLSTALIFLLNSARGCPTGSGSYIAWGFMPSSIAKSFFFSIAFNLLALRYFYIRKSSEHSLLFIIFFFIGFLSNSIVSFSFFPLYIIFSLASNNNFYDFFRKRLSLILITGFLLFLISDFWIYYNWIEVFMNSNIFRFGTRAFPKERMIIVCEIVESFSFYWAFSIFLSLLTIRRNKLSKALLLTQLYFIFVSLSGALPYSVPRSHRFPYVGIFFFSMSFPCFLMHSKTNVNKIIRYCIALFLVLGFITNAAIYAENISQKDEYKYLLFLKEYTGIILAPPYYSYGIQAYTDLKTFVVADAHEGSILQKYATQKIKAEINHLYRHLNSELLNQFYKDHKFDYLLLNKAMKKSLENEIENLDFKTKLLKENDKLCLYEVGIDETDNNRN